MLLHLSPKRGKITNLKNKKNLLLTIIGLVIISLVAYFFLIRIPHEKKLSNYSATINLVQRKNSRLDDLLNQAKSLEDDSKYIIDEVTKKELDVAISNGEKVEIKIPTTFDEVNQKKKDVKIVDYTTEINNLENVISKIKSKS